MTPTYRIKPPSPFVNELNLAQSLSASSSSSSSGRTFFSSDQDQGETFNQELQSPHLLPEKKEESSEDQGDRDDHSSQKWLPSKIRIIRKMMRSNQVGGNRVAVYSAHKTEDQKQFPSLPVESDTSTKGSSYTNTDNTVRVCSDCNTTKTPLWRSGPRGPKSLCNACGIRQRKARRALAAAAAAANGTILPPATPSVKIKVKAKTKRSKNDGNNDPQFKRGCKDKRPANSSPPKKTKSNLCYEDFTSRILSKHYSAYQRVFPQDEREAAILLMALSYGLVHG